MPRPAHRPPPRPVRGDCDVLSPRPVVGAQNHCQADQPL